MADPDTETETDTAVVPVMAEPELLRRAKRERERGNLSGIKWLTSCVMRCAVSHNAAVIIIVVKIHSGVMSLLGQSLENCCVTK